MSQLEEHRTEINGVTYVMTMLPVATARPLSFRLVKVFAPALATLQKSNDLAISIEQLVDTLKQKDLDDLTDALKGVTRIETEEGFELMNKAFNLHFKGRMRQYYTWLVWGVKVQFADFLDAWP